MDPVPDHGETSYTGTDKLSGRVAIVTGADSGIGRAVAIAFAKEGASVLLSYLPEEEADAAETASVIQEAGQKAIRIPGDIGDPKYAVDLVKRAFQEFGKLDVVVNNAGFQMTRESIEDVPVERSSIPFERMSLEHFFSLEPHCRS